MSSPGILERWHFASQARCSRCCAAVAARMARDRCAARITPRSCGSGGSTRLTGPHLKELDFSRNSRGRKPLTMAARCCSWEITVAGGTHATDFGCRPLARVADVGGGSRLMWRMACSNALVTHDMCGHLRWMGILRWAAVRRPHGTTIRGDVSGSLVAYRRWVSAADAWPRRHSQFAVAERGGSQRWLAATDGLVTAAYDRARRHRGVSIEGCHWRVRADGSTHMPRGKLHKAIRSFGILFKDVSGQVIGRYSFLVKADDKENMKLMSFLRGSQVIK
ncbi:5'-nucleotidase SurE [Striga asiatica]|uniref:5'-nucleotidase SurE n=1 Tax=Striga asiatica TaxID=4170 RepID=A0A5A7QLH0_STRAF|nr:5'-nucleotidase SurE [Striga asiatica]